ncbi:MAG: heparinase II/III family protein [Armatimonadota bacterium]
MSGALCLLVVCALLLIAATYTVSADPRTLYRPNDIETARRNIERYDWAKAIANSWQRRAEFSLAKDREFFEELIPEFTPGTFYGQNCPACVGEKSVMGSGAFRWSINDPDHVRCRYCGTVYPNEEYPETGVLECPRMGQTFTYYETPEEKHDPENRNKHAFKWLGKRPQMTSFTGMVRAGKVRWAYNELLPLAKAYTVTEDVRYAERAAWILDRFARVYPNYLYHSYDTSIADCPPAEAARIMAETPRSGGTFPRETVRNAYGLNRGEDWSTLYNGFWGAGRLSVHGKGSDAGPLLEMTIAYDLIHEATYPDGTPVVTEKMHTRIVEDLLQAGCNDMEYWDSVSNKGVATYSLSAAVGLLLQQPPRVHRAIRGFERIFGERYHFDGFYSESPAYAAHNFSNMRELPDLLYNYSDPPDYEPEEGTRVENYNPFAAGRFHLALVSMVRMLAPDGKFPVIGDTHHGTGPNPLYIEMLVARKGAEYAGLYKSVTGLNLHDQGSEYSLWYRSPELDLSADDHGLPLYTEWFPGWHVGVLRGGNGDNSTALYINGNEHRWTRHTGHRHTDILSTSFYAYGEEMVIDRGYFSGSGQLTPDGLSGQVWARSSLSHNLVVIDEKDQARRGCGSDLELFGNAPGIQVIQASSSNAYPQCEQYRRTCIMVQRPDRQHYVVDLFRVTGGQTHQYTFTCKGSLKEWTPPTASADVELAPAWSKWLTKTCAVTPDTPHTFTWDDDGRKMDLTILNDTETVDRVIVADSPGWRSSKMSEFDNPPLQQLLAEHRADEAEEALSTQYAAVMVPYKEDVSPVHAASLVANDADTDVIAVRVDMADRTDYLISTRDQQQRTYGPVTAAGEIAFVSVDAAGRVLSTYLLKGTNVRCGEVDVSITEPALTLPVASTSGSTYHLAENLPPDIAAQGAYVIAAGELPITEDTPRPRTGFEVQSTTADSITVRDYPVVECDEITLLNSAWLQFER